MKFKYAIEGGLAGAAAVTLLHESIKKVVPKSPRLDRLGMQAMSKGLRVVGKIPPTGNRLYGWSLTGDILANALFYSIAAIGKRDAVLGRGAVLGLAAGVGAVLLPGPLGLNDRYTNKTATTQIMTIGLYVIGGIVAAGVMKLLDRKKQKMHADWEQRLVTSSMA